MELIDRLPAEKRPQCVRGDCGFGNDATMLALEQRKLPYLFKLKLTKNVKRYLEQIFWSEGWQDAGQGWEGREGPIKLTGWNQSRRVIALRRPLIGDVLLADESQQLGLAFVESECPAKRYEYAVLVTDLPYDVLALAQLYRDRADSENTFDELKNQWGAGRLHHKGSQAQPLCRHDGGVDLQLVVLVCPSGAPLALLSPGTAGGDYQPTLFAVWHCQKNHSCRAATSEDHTPAWQGRTGQSHVDPR